MMAGQTLPGTASAQPPSGEPTLDELLAEPIVRQLKRGGNKRTVEVREVVNGLMYLLSSGCQWRAIGWRVRRADRQRLLKTLQVPKANLTEACDAPPTAQKRASHG